MKRSEFKNYRCENCGWTGFLFDEKTSSFVCRACGTSIPVIDDVDGMLDDEEYEKIQTRFDGIEEQLNSMKGILESSSKDNSDEPSFSGDIDEDISNRDDMTEETDNETVSNEESETVNINIDTDGIKEAAKEIRETAKELNKRSSEIEEEYENDEDAEDDNDDEDDEDDENETYTPSYHYHGGGGGGTFVTSIFMLLIGMGLMMSKFIMEAIRPETAEAVTAAEEAAENTGAILGNMSALTTTMTYVAMTIGVIMIITAIFNIAKHLINPYG